MFTTCSWLFHDLFMTFYWSWLVNNLFMFVWYMFTIAHGLFTTFAHWFFILFHASFMTFWHLYNLFTNSSKSLNVLFMRICSQITFLLLAHDLFMTCPWLITLSGLTHELFIISSWLVCDSVTTFFKDLFRICLHLDTEEKSQKD